MESRFQGKGRPYTTRHILLSDSANCTVLRAVVLTQYQRVTDGQTDGQTDGIAVASTALAMRALRRAVIKSSFISSDYSTTEDTQHNLPNTVYFSVDDFNRGGEITNPGEDTPLPYFTMGAPSSPQNCPFPWGM